MTILLWSLQLLAGPVGVWQTWIQSGCRHSMKTYWAVRGRVRKWKRAQASWTGERSRVTLGPLRVALMVARSGTPSTGVRKCAGLSTLATVV